MKLNPPPAEVRTRFTELSPEGKRQMLKQFSADLTVSMGVTMRKHLAEQKERMERLIPGYKHHYRPH